MITRALWLAAMGFASAGLALPLVVPPMPRETLSIGVPEPVRPMPPRSSDVTGHSSIITSNIFSPSRTPPPSRFIPKQFNVARAPAFQTPPGHAKRETPLQLRGITISSAGSTAVIDGDPAVPGSGLYRVGDRIAGGAIVAIRDSAVVIAQTSGRLVLRLPSPSSPKRPRE